MHLHFDALSSHPTVRGTSVPSAIEYDCFCQHIIVTCVLIHIVVVPVVAGLVSLLTVGFQRAVHRVVVAAG